MNFRKLQERQLIHHCLNGKPAAQKKLYDMFTQDMFRICVSYASDYDSANDLLQEGFLKVFQNLHKFDKKGSLGGWIRTVIVNNCIDAYRRDKWREKKTDLHEHSIQNTNLVSINEAQSQFDQDDFLSITSQLPLGYKTILNLYFLEEYTHKEIASKLGITEGTSKSQLFKAKKYLKEILMNSLSEEEIEKYGGLAKKVV
jgi:RNA polymerase sigma factor (sigma-70 family)